jgi:acetyl esterase/lipase
LNRLAMIKVVSWLRREPFAVSSIPVVDDLADPDSGELVAGLPTAQVPRRELDSTLSRSLTYAEQAGGKRPRRLRMDIHVPKAPGPHPLVVYIPGGGFAVSLYKRSRRQRAYLADAGFVVASMEYRTISDRATYKDGLDDVADAVAYLRAHAAEFKIDPRRVALWGESAGAYLAALAATHGTTGAHVRAVVDMVGASDLSQVADGFDDATRAMWDGPHSPVARYVGNPPPSDANPLKLIDASTQPFLLLHGDDDRIVSPRQSLILHRALTNAGVPSRRLVLAGAGHGELALATSDINAWTSKALMDKVVEFLRSYTQLAEPELPSQ